MGLKLASWCSGMSARVLAHDPYRYRKGLPAWVPSRSAWTSWCVSATSLSSPFRIRPVPRV
ncbi:hypothetical protein [Streptomyces sp. KLMMK]|uniref:hypothetical protein n=1 Tax=Streptomyces sp. KLMMK TaxID=3109353 RepID=UPI003FA707E7